MSFGTFLLYFILAIICIKFALPILGVILGLLLMGWEVLLAIFVLWIIFKVLF